MGRPAISNLEREVKLEADLDLALPDLRGLVGGTFRLPEQDLRAAYFDTPDFRLWNRGITLRQRTGEGPASGTWTLKLPRASTAKTLDRTELSWPGSREEVPGEARRLLRGIVRNAELQQVAELNTLRRPLELQDRHGHRFAVLDDDTVTVSGGPHDGLRFREVEIELADETGPSPEDGGRADDDVLDAVVAALRKAGARPSDSPKLAIALGLGDAPAGRGAGGGLDKHSSLGEVVRASIDTGLGRLLDHDVGLRLDPSKPPEHDVHQARVATRRLRSDLKTFRSALDPVWVRHTRDDLRWLGDALGKVRDIDVLTAGLGRRAKESPIDAAGQRELLGHLAEQRRIACRQLSYVLEGDKRYLHLLDRLHGGAQGPPFRAKQGPGRQGRRDPLPDNPARNVLPRMVGKSWRSLRKQVRRAGDHPTDAQLHRIRIKAKQLRYGSEAAIPVIGKQARRTADAAQDLQTVLGDHHDAVGAEQWLWSEALGASPWGSFSAGQLTAEQRRIQFRLRKVWRRDWKQLDQKKVRAWLE
jgi:CHAD domain-containing protein